jgi:hypothetical protein
MLFCRPVVVSAGTRKLLIVANAFAAAASFVGAWLIAGRLPFIELKWATIVAGFASLAYFTRRAESLRRPQASSDPD